VIETYLYRPSNAGSCRFLKYMVDGSQNGGMRIRTKAPGQASLNNKSPRYKKVVLFGAFK
jgi:hypothetical protein